MSAVAQVAADLTTTVGGGTRAIKFLGVDLKPSANLGKGEQHLNSAISTLECIVEQKPHCISKNDVEDLHKEHNRLNNLADNIRQSLDTPWSFDIGVIKRKVSAFSKSRGLKKEAKALNADVQRSSRKAASRNIRDRMGDVNTILEHEDPSPHTDENGSHRTDPNDAFTGSEVEPSRSNWTQQDASDTLAEELEQDIALLPISEPRRSLTCKDSNATLRASRRGEELCEDPFADNSQDGER